MDLNHTHWPCDDPKKRKPEPIRKERNQRNVCINIYPAWRWTLNRRNVRPCGTFYWRQIKCQELRVCCHLSRKRNRYDQRYCNQNLSKGPPQVLWKQIGLPLAKMKKIIHFDLLQVYSIFISFHNFLNHRILKATNMFKIYLYKNTQSHIYQLALLCD